MDCLGQSIQAASHRPERVAALLDKLPDAVVTPADAARVLLSPRGGRKNVGEKPFRCILNKADTPKRRTGAEEMASILAAQGVITAITFYTEEEQGGLCWF
jgi:molybdenum cofactor cytidylyltransferase